MGYDRASVVDRGCDRDCSRLAHFPTLEKHQTLCGPACVGWEQHSRCGAQVRERHMCVALRLRPASSLHSNRQKTTPIQHGEHTQHNMITVSESSSKDMLQGCWTFCRGLARCTALKPCLISAVAPGLFSTLSLSNMLTLASAIFQASTLASTSARK